MASTSTLLAALPLPRVEMPGHRPLGVRQHVVALQLAAVDRDLPGPIERRPPMVLDLGDADRGQGRVGWGIGGLVRRGLGATEGATESGYLRC
jgi:hypothetical protein